MSNPLAGRFGAQQAPQATQGSGLMARLPCAIKQASKMMAVIKAAQNPQAALMDYCKKSGAFNGYTGPQDPESMTRWLCERNGIPVDDILNMVQSPGAQGLGNKLTKLLKGG